MKLMKIISICCFLLFLAGCSNKEDKTSKPTPVTTIVGKIENPGDYLIEFVVHDSITIVDLNEDNTFTFSTNKIVRSGEIEFIHQQHSGSLYVIPGTQLTFNTDNNLFYANAKFEGPAANYNHYLFKKVLIQQSSENLQTLYSNSEQDFLDKINQLKNYKLQLLYSFKGVFTDEDYFKMEEGNILYEWANQLMSYGNMHAMLLNEPTYETGDSLKRLLNAIPLEKPELLNSYRYVNFVFDHITQKVNESLASVTIPTDQIVKVMLDTSVEKTNQLIGNQEIKRRIVTEFVNQYYLDMNEADRAEAIQQYQQYLSLDNVERLKKTAKELSVD